MLLSVKLITRNGNAFPNEIFKKGSNMELLRGAEAHRMKLAFLHKTIIY